MSEVSREMRSTCAVCRSLCLQCLVQVLKHRSEVVSRNYAVLWLLRASYPTVGKLCWWVEVGEESEWIKLRSSLECFLSQVPGVGQTTRSKRGGRSWEACEGAAAMVGRSEVPQALPCRFTIEKTTIDKQPHLAAIVECTTYKKHLLHVALSVMTMPFHQLSHSSLPQQPPSAFHPG